jgi:endonuclease VIII
VPPAAPAGPVYVVGGAVFCQPGPFPSLAERPSRPGLRRGVNEESFGSRGRRLRGEPGYARGRRA